MGKRKLPVFLGSVLFWWVPFLPLLQNSNQEYKYVASKFMIHYHLPTCRMVKRIQNQNGVVFVSAQDAIKAGYRPCGLCKPPVKDASKDKEILKVLFQDAQGVFSLMKPNVWKEG
jgi:hypothetical protein